MDLKDFVKETISSIVEATNELQEQWAPAGVVLNPPVSVGTPGVYQENSAAHTYRPIQSIKFDVAITATSETAKGGKAGIKIFAAEAGVDGKHARQNQEVSRVQFEVPLTLRPSESEHANVATRERWDREADRRYREIEQQRERGY